jgi:hypothetical protein
MSITKRAHGLLAFLCLAFTSGFAATARVNNFETHNHGV